MNHWTKKGKFGYSKEDYARLLELDKSPILSGYVLQPTIEYQSEAGGVDRNNLVDKLFRIKYKNQLLALAENKCVLCGDSSNGMDLDHFYTPFSRGGRFVMINNSGKLVNNCFPLCRTCNRSKSDSIIKVSELKEDVRCILKKIDKKLPTLIDKEDEIEFKKYLLVDRL